jgi:hypothetical protein
MSKSRQIKTKRQRKKVDLVDRYQEIGISAVAAALRCQSEKRPASNNRSTGGPVRVRFSFLAR